MSKIDTYVWKDKRLTKDRQEKQVEYKLVDMDEYTLNKAYEHCKEMLYNDDKKFPGRELILKMISEQLDCCGAELALRYFKNLKNEDGTFKYSEQSLLSDLREWFPDYNEKTYKLQDLPVQVDKIDSKFYSVNVNSLMKACRDALGAFDHSKITLTFLYNNGVYFTQEESMELDRYTLRNSLAEKVDILKLQLGLPETTDVHVNPKGLTEKEFRDMIHMKKLKGFRSCKYSDLTTSQLETLRNKVLYALEEKVAYQAMTWKELMRQIEEVAKFKNYTLK